MGRNGHGPKWLWAEIVMGRNDPESELAVFFLSIWESGRDPLNLEN